MTTNLMKRDNFMPAPMMEPPFGKTKVDEDTGFIGRGLEKWRLKDLHEIKTREADIAAEQLRYTNSELDRMMALMTFGPRCQLALDEIEHRRIMMRHEEVKEQAKAQEAYFDMKITEMDFRIREREYKKISKEEDDDER